jgi:signal peptidase I
MSVLPAVSTALMKRRILTRLLAGIAGLLLVAAGWFYLGPAQLGGTTSYAVIVGNSMEPLLHRGDLAVARSQGSYRPGDVVLYDSPQLGAKVLHRLVRIERGRYVLKGDNNGFVDSERPTEGRLVGKLALTVPAAGRVAAWVHRPAHAALLVGLATLLALGGAGGLGIAHRRRGRGRHRVGPLRWPFRSAMPVDLQPLVLALGVGVGLFGLLAAVAFTRPEKRLETLAEAYVQEGRLDYTARVPRSPVYPDGLVSTGEPVFLRLVPRLRFAFDYRLTSRSPLAASGRISLDALLTDGRGWERVLPLAPEQSFAGPGATASGSLDLRGIQALIERVDALTGSSQTAYTLSILPRISVAGTTASRPLQATFAPKVTFDLVDQRLQPTGTGGGVNPFAPRQAVTGTRLAADEIAVGPLVLRVTSARLLSVVGLLVSLLFCGLAAAALVRRRRADEPARIRAHFGHLLTSAASRGRGWSGATELTDIDSLARLAEHYDRLILHLVEPGGHTYVVEEGANAYVYRTGEKPSPPSVFGDADARPMSEESLGDALVGALIPGGGGRRYGPGRRRPRPASRRATQRR